MARAALAGFKADNDAYERWLRSVCDVVEADLDYKHRRMKKHPFIFLRATYFRWARIMPSLLPDLAGSPAVLGVGDVHLENFGTWRDAEGRLVWGVNDFDEASMLPYAFDLVRLAASARLAPGMRHTGRTICKAILDGYRRGLEKPRPTLLDEHETWMRPHVACSDEDRQSFWAKVDKLPGKRKPPTAVLAGFAASLPPEHDSVRYATRVAGGGSLGRPRFVAVASSRGGRVVREAKALVPSAWDWARGNGRAPSRLMALAKGPHRAPDPFLAVHGSFVLRRLAADSRKVELGEDAGAGVAIDLLAAMGRDLGSIHAAEPARTAQVKRDLQARDMPWLRKASKLAAGAVLADYEAWR